MRRAAIAIAIVSLAWAAPAAAWKSDTLAPGVRPIAEVNANAESGDLVVVEGQITDVKTGSGSRFVVTLEDETGSVLVRVPEHLLRKLNDGRPPEIGRHVRVGGKWDHASLDDKVWGIHAQTAERVE
jgi:hypothetical protein